MDLAQRRTNQMLQHPGAAILGAFPGFRSTGAPGYNPNDVKPGLPESLPSVSLETDSTPRRQPYNPNEPMSQPAMTNQAFANPPANLAVDAQPQPDLYGDNDAQYFSTAQSAPRNHESILSPEYRNLLSREADLAGQISDAYTKIPQPQPAHGLRRIAGIAAAAGTGFLTMNPMVAMGTYRAVTDEPYEHQRQQAMERISGLQNSLTNFSNASKSQYNAGEVMNKSDENANIAANTQLRQDEFNNPHFEHFNLGDKGYRFNPKTSEAAPLPGVVDETPDYATLTGLEDPNHPGQTIDAVYNKKKGPPNIGQPGNGTNVYKKSPQSLIDVTREQNPGITYQALGDLVRPNFGIDTTNLANNLRNANSGTANAIVGNIQKELQTQKITDSVRAREYAEGILQDMSRDPQFAPYIDEARRQLSVIYPRPTKTGKPNLADIIGGVTQTPQAK